MKKINLKPFLELYIPLGWEDLEEHPIKELLNEIIIDNEKFDSDIIRYLVFNKSIISNTRFINITLENLYFKNVNFINVLFENANLNNILFKNCTFTNISFTNSKIKYNRFYMSNFSDMSYNNTVFQDCILNENCRVDLNSFPSCQGISIEHSPYIKNDEIIYQKTPLEKYLLK